MIKRMCDQVNKPKLIRRNSDGILLERFSQTNCNYAYLQKINNKLGYKFKNRLFQFTGSPITPTSVNQVISFTPTSYDPFLCQGNLMLNEWQVTSTAIYQVNIVLSMEADFATFGPFAGSVKTFALFKNSTALTQSRARAFTLQTNSPLLSVSLIWVGPLKQGDLLSLRLTNADGPVEIQDRSITIVEL